MGLSPDLLDAVPGFGADVKQNRAEARALMEKQGYGPNRQLKVKLATRGIALYKEPAMLLQSQLRDIDIDADLEIVETSLWFARLGRKDYTLGLNATGNGVDDPDQTFFENFACASERNYTGYCNPEIEKLMDLQSVEPDVRSGARSWARSTSGCWPTAHGRRSCGTAPRLASSRRSRATPAW